MSHAYSAYDGPPPRTFEEAMAALEAMETAYEGEQPPTASIRAFVDALLARWPDISDEQGEQSPWSDGPMVNNAAGSVIHFGVVYSRLDEAEPFVVETARHHGLVLVDQEEGRVLVPGGIPPRNDELATSQPKRRWFRRRR
jgi:hypothetical protein